MGIGSLFDSHKSQIFFSSYFILFRYAVLADKENYNGFYQRYFSFSDIFLGFLKVSHVKVSGKTYWKMCNERFYVSILK